MSFPGPPYDEQRALGPERPRRVLPARVVLFGALLVLILIVTSKGSVRTWWAHRVHDVTGGSWGADYTIGLVIAALPVVGVALGALGARGPRRVFRMFLFGGLGFVITFLLAPSPARYLTDRASVRSVDALVPGYLPGALTGTGIWILLAIVAVVRARSWWRRVTSQTGRNGDRPTDPRIIDI